MAMWGMRRALYPSILPLEAHGMGLTSLAYEPAQACCWEEGGETCLRHPLGTVAIAEMS
jgi:hypothetical protein